MEVKMKTKIILLCGLALFAFTVTSCKNNGNEPEPSLQILKERLIGEWLELNPWWYMEDSNTVIFTNDSIFYNTTTTHNGYTENWRMQYELLTNNSIFISYSRQNHLMEGNYKIIFLSDDSIFIGGFKPQPNSGHGKPYPSEHYDILLKKKNGGEK